MKTKLLNNIRFYQSYDKIGFNPENDKIIDNCLDSRLYKEYKEIFRNYSFRVFENPKNQKRLYLHNYMKHPEFHCIIIK